MTVQAIVALGSNLQNPEQQIQAAITALSCEQNIKIVRVSSLYLTKPVGYLDQPDFINAVVLINTQLSAQDLLDTLHKIEHTFGRVRTFTNAPRVLDLDLIDYNHQTISTDTLVLPHPRAHERSFVLCPLNEIAPDYQLPGAGVVSELIKTLDTAGIQKLENCTFNAL
ncbi:2-amino-4-hydroxy-6-hydroxymethyldihydropteridine diphosphokinase [Neisseria sp. Ec49-e6-T10]|uniref:2-amino-4-hydroxy-6- hydroxymethyldihydropteridine diphosphokinase n=1 Tax=Neisseria sp. Ec49-e6-T10 TaxID=3140744 RepID=UPI003EBA46BF